MTRFHLSHPSWIYPTGTHFDRGPNNRLIVLFPAQAADYPNQSHRIWEIASSLGMNVLLLSLCNDHYEESQLRRQLITMAALIEDGHICAEIKIEHGNDWMGHVKSIYRSGDVIACYAGLRVGLMQKFLHEVLRSQLDAPIYILAADQPIKNCRPKLLSYNGCVPEIIFLDIFNLPADKKRHYGVLGTTSLVAIARAPHAPERFPNAGGTIYSSILSISMGEGR